MREKEKGMEVREDLIGGRPYLIRDSHAEGSCCEERTARQSWDDFLMKRSLIAAEQWLRCLPFCHVNVHVIDFAFLLRQSAESVAEKEQA